MVTQAPKILVSLPMAAQDGLDKHAGIMRFLRENDITWDIRLDRMVPTWDRPSLADIPRADGAIVDGFAPLSVIRAYAAADIPLVAIDWRHPDITKGRTRFARIDADSREIGRTAASTLLALNNYASFAFLPFANDIQWSVERGEAFRKVLARKGVVPVELKLKGNLERQLRRLPKPVAIFAANDIVAAMALNAARHEGISVPEDVSVLGVDNETFTCIHTTPPLASVQPDFVKAGYLAAASLAKLLDGKRVPVQTLYHVKGVVRRRSMEPTGTAGRLVQRALEIINDPQADPIKGINDLAGRLGVSRRLLDLRFRQIQSRSVLDVIQEKRMERVCELLRSTNLPIAEICSTCGIGSGTYPMRAFRKRFGVSMRDWRKAQRSSAP